MYQSLLILVNKNTTAQVDQIILTDITFGFNKVEVNIALEILFIVS